MARGKAYFISTASEDALPYLERIMRGEALSEEQTEKLQEIVEMTAYCRSADNINERFAGIYADYAEDVEHWQSDFEALIKRCGGEIIHFDNNMFFRMSKQVIQDWLKPAYKQFCQLAAELTLDDFCDRQKMLEVETAIGLLCNDALMINDGYYDSLDDGMRYIEVDRWYLAEGASLLH